MHTEILRYMRLLAVVLGAAGAALYYDLVKDLLERAKVILDMIIPLLIAGASGIAAWNLIWPGRPLGNSRELPQHGVIHKKRTKPKTA